MRIRKAQNPTSFDQGYKPHPLHARIPPAGAHNIPVVARRGPAHSASLWWGLLHTGHGCSLPLWSGGWEVQSDLQGQRGRKQETVQWSKVMHKVARFAIKGNAHGPRGPSEHTQVPPSPWTISSQDPCCQTLKATGFLKLTLDSCG